jgi:hypothetical protein
LFWQLVDCSFGVVGIIPLYIACRYTYQLQILQTAQNKLSRVRGA